MFLFIGKAIILYIIAIGVIRLMGKSAFAQLTAHDLTGIFFVITLAMGPLVTEKFSYAIVGVMVIGVLHIVLSKLTLINALNKIFIGQPTLIIKHGKLIKENLKRTHFTLAGVLSSLREKGYPDLTLVEFAIIETSGEISIIPKRETAPVTPGQLGMKTDYQGIPIAVIVEGKIQYRNLKYLNKDEQWLKKELQLAGYPDQETIFYAAVRDKDHHLVTIDLGMGSSY
ncbi:DUF421 domain-containing protein [Virgibacillus dakarensis]|uniref:DUF421 domain-containing protein n=1 Tax=Lentibacillus populi TaxID=1827502 RepID=A0A9W5X4A5_9BACI|nr:MULTISPECIES: DUF421 domain-containing protein [Bacillaceae]MBT2214332.1 DUF421 domain-containing protein [Virgibacillus dakarensis]MTW85009.1 DUF421 domain-containing protein [Virgibacillus dakarensis]GGB34000.1 DUF421 domain-containing protein [Lentibacillus populi]